jgi:two-component system, cell cycle sensor histidine kinase and response regulator CckA
MTESSSSTTGFCELFGLSESPVQLHGVTAFDLLDCIAPAYRDPEAELRRIREIVSQKRTVRGEEVPLTDGRTVIRDFIPIAVAGKKHCRLWHHYDIAERRVAEQERARLEAQLHRLQKAESLDRMARATAHHFNNLLQAVVLELEIAMGLLPSQGSAVASLEGAMASAQRAVELSRLMVTYLGRSMHEKSALDLGDACREGLDRLRKLRPEISFAEPERPQPGPLINAAASAVQQALSNLVDNAWEAGGNKSRPITISISSVDGPKVPAAQRIAAVTRPEARRYACLAVTDSGSGISLDHIDKIFDPFFSTKFVGRGLGLTVVVGMARACSGFVTVESEPGRGSVFRIFFPAQD